MVVKVARVGGRQDKEPFHSQEQTEPQWLVFVFGRTVYDPRTMDTQVKATVLQEAKDHIETVRAATVTEIQNTSAHIEQYRHAGNDPVAQKLYAHFLKD